MMWESLKEGEEVFGAAIDEETIKALEESLKKILGEYDSEDIDNMIVYSADPKHSVITSIIKEDTEFVFKLEDGTEFGVCFEDYFTLNSDHFYDIDKNLYYIFATDEVSALTEVKTILKDRL